MVKKSNQREIPQLNERLIKLFKDVTVIDTEGKNLGVMTSRDALRTAYDQGLDLFCVSDKIQPPICKILSYGKFKYEEAKRAKDHKKKPQELKTLIMGPNIAVHDLDTLVRKATDFIGKNDKVQFTCKFRVKELAHPHIGKQKLEYCLDKLANIAQTEREILFQGRQMTVTLLPKK
jgi:translation initiation factor IF-3